VDVGWRRVFAVSPASGGHRSTTASGGSTAQFTRGDRWDVKLHRRIIERIRGAVVEAFRKRIAAKGMGTTHFVDEIADGWKLAESVRNSNEVANPGSGLMLVTYPAL
jgi:hypothetical protein